MGNSTYGEYMNTDTRARFLHFRGYLYANGLEMADLCRTLDCSYENIRRHVLRRASERRMRPSRRSEIIDAIYREAIAWQPHNGTNSTKDTILSLIVKPKDHAVVTETTDAAADAEAVHDDR
jgi:hypothetical protein